ncbi:MAG: hypothetical protein GY799_30705 [Desulfobulbaceae bacterium]|nr:hypothetical protein [Desulfobulbaceae bacterium]
MIDTSRLFVVSHRSLRILAALIWYGGCIALLLKGSSLLLEADALKPAQEWSWIAAITGLILGGLKGESLFKRSCRNNLERINALARPQIWQFFRPRFFVFMTLMILFGATLSKLAHNNYLFLICVAIIDLSIAVALLWSSRLFWK